MCEKYKIEFDREECIGCSACAAVNPKFWEMKEDAKSHLINSNLENNKEILESEENYQDNIDAAESCPVNCIHIFKEEKKII